MQSYGRHLLIPASSFWVLLSRCRKKPKWCIVMACMILHNILHCRYNMVIWIITLQCCMELTLCTLGETWHWLPRPREMSFFLVNYFHNRGAMPWQIDIDFQWHIEFQCYKLFSMQFHGVHLYLFLNRFQTTFTLYFKVIFIFNESKFSARPEKGYTEGIFSSQDLELWWCRVQTPLW